MASTEALEALRAIYNDADALFEAWSCTASTDCCRFAVTGREPYVTSIELHALERAAAQAPAPRRRGLPVVAAQERRCPFLTDEGRCAAYTWRPLGCRTFWCDRATPASKVRHTEVTALVRRIKELAARHVPGGDLGRPLTRALAAR